MAPQAPFHPPPTWQQESYKLHFPNCLPAKARYKPGSTGLAGLSGTERGKTWAQPVLARLQVLVGSRRQKCVRAWARPGPVSSPGLWPGEAVVPAAVAEGEAWSRRLTAGFQVQ